MVDFIVKQTHLLLERFFYRWFILSKQIHWGLENGFQKIILGQFFLTIKTEKFSNLWKQEVMSTWILWR